MPTVPEAPQPTAELVAAVGQDAIEVRVHAVTWGAAVDIALANEALLRLATDRVGDEVIAGLTGAGIIAWLDAGLDDEALARWRDASAPVRARILAEATCLAPGAGEAGTGRSATTPSASRPGCWRPTPRTPTPCCGGRR